MNWYDRHVPSEGPDNAHILFVGEAPGEQEHEDGHPFVGPSGDILWKCTGRYGVSREDVRVANLFPYRPVQNNFFKVLNSDELKRSLAELYIWIAAHKPFVIVPLGNWPLHFLTNDKVKFNKGKPAGIMKWRGSIIPYKHDPSIKVIATLHPAAVTRDRGLYPTFDLDIRRIVEDSAFREFRLPQREFILDPRGLDCEEWVQRLSAADFLGSDIETVKRSRHILCMGFAPEPGVGVCFSTSHPEGRRAIDRVLRSPAKKIFQFGSFDTTQLVACNGYQINDPQATELSRPYFWDTLIAQHVLQPELPRSLEYLTSIYTREPYYKTEGRANIPDDSKGWSDKVDREGLHRYNARDCCVTIEIALEQMKELGDQKDIFQFEMESLNVAHHIGDAGLPIDEERRAIIENLLLRKWVKKQALLDTLTGYETNVKGNKTLYSLLYDKDKVGLPVRRKRDGSLTADEDAIVSLISYTKDHIESLKTDSGKAKWLVKLKICQLILEIRGIRQVLSNYILPSVKSTGVLRVSPIDGRLHSMVKVGATETGRWAMMKYVDGSGFNAQTLPRDPIEVPDEEFDLAQSQVEKMLEEVMGDASGEEDDLEEEAA